MRACQEVGERLSIVGDDVVDGIRKPSRELEETSAMASCAAVVGPHEESQGVTSLGCHLGPCLENSVHLLEGHWDATDTEGLLIHTFLLSSWSALIGGMAHLDSRFSAGASSFTASLRRAKLLKSERYIQRRNHETRNLH